MRYVLPLLVGAALAAHISAARADELDDRHGVPYYAGHASASAVMFGIGFGVPYLGHGPGVDLVGFPPDDLARLKFSESAADTSNVLLGLTIGIPLAAQLSDGGTTTAGNAALVYTEAHAANFMLNSIVKTAVRRPRPYTHSPLPRVSEWTDNQGGAAYASFYSLHASSAFTAAMAGSILYSLRTDDRAARVLMWIGEFGLAATTSQLRVTAGRHYPTDVLTGAVVGAGLGLLTPVVHGLDLGEVRPEEWIIAGTSGVLLAGLELLSLCESLRLFPLCLRAERDVRLPLTRDSDEHTDHMNLVVLPAAFEGGAGVQMILW